MHFYSMLFLYIHASGFSGQGAADVVGPKRISNGKEGKLRIKNGFRIPLPNPYLILQFVIPCVNTHLDKLIVADNHNK